MKLQLTKDKAIEIPFGGSGGSRSAAKTDLTGIELFSPTAMGCPAVHLYKKKGEWHLGAADFLPPPNGNLPSQWEEVSHQPTWALPREFQAPGAALAVNSALGVFGQSSPEAIVQEMMHGVGAPAQPAAESSGGKKKLGIKKAASSAPKPAAETPTGSRPVFPDPGTPVSQNGRRFVVKPVAEDGFYLSSSLPEFQSLWLSRLLPEGKRPTAVSVQLAEAALLPSLLAQPLYKEMKGSLLAVFVTADAVYFGGYKDGAPALWRKCPGNVGYVAMCETVKKSLSIGDDLVQSVLEDSVIDPRPALEPFLHPILDQLELARVYLTGKHNLDSSRILLAGLPYGANHWAHFARELLHVEITPVATFDGIVVDKGVKVTSPHLFQAALGATLAASEDET